MSPVQEAIAVAAFLIVYGGIAAALCHMVRMTRRPKAQQTCPKCGAHLMVNGGCWHCGSGGAA